MLFSLSPYPHRYSTAFTFSGILYPHPRHFTFHGFLTSKRRDTGLPGSEQIPHQTAQVPSLHRQCCICDEGVISLHA
jgi:hypothetical protein